ncbi:Chitin synthase export chaperone [Talaromyces atroroseus]|uniref:Chitin synthase export chaperone n=1 Tax=Talaromyces atroroseus TaxID=1441469 RepID=A0A225A5R1_TALAT|nr:Chitin synthase export chaperone [Talaromyces atroroseus]OKL55781.1 Chitin synthase export chaperone [Talaromyces atroroseus]
MSGITSLDSFCQTVPVPLCSLIGPDSSITGSPGILPNCYARNIDVGNTIIFQAASDFAHIGALVIIVIMILHVRSKFTAVGRKEILTFFYLFMILTVWSLVVDAGVVPPHSSPWPYFVAAQNGLVSACCTCLLVNGFVGFQLYEDGTKLSVWLLRASSAGMFVISFVVSLFTFKGWGGLEPSNPVGVFVVVYILNAIFLFIYVVMQLLLVYNTLEDRWPLGHIALGVFFFVAGQIVLYVFSGTVCNGTSHYLDGLFIGTLCNLFTVMMIYKYWDSITAEDLEFSVGVKRNNWEVKDIYEEDRRLTMYPDNGSEYAPSTHYRSSTFGGNHSGF